MRRFCPICKGKLDSRLKEVCSRVSFEVYCPRCSGIKPFYFRAEVGFGFTLEEAVEDWDHMQEERDLQNKKVLSSWSEIPIQVIDNPSYRSSDDGSFLVGEIPTKPRRMEYD